MDLAKLLGIFRKFENASQALAGLLAAGSVTTLWRSGTGPLYNRTLPRDNPLKLTKTRPS